MNVDEWNDEMLSLTKQWANYEERAYPRGWAGVNIDGHELVLLDADIAQLVTSVIKQGPLKQGSVAYLARLTESLRSILPSITGEGRAYFEELADLADVAAHLSRSAAGG